MSDESSQPSIPVSKPVDSLVIRVLRALNPIAQELECPYFVAGATARDLVLVSVHGLRPGRATFDIDLGIAVENWEQFATLKDRLIHTGAFDLDRRAAQRLTYTDPADGTVTLVDLIPFRGVESDGSIAWPPEWDIVMNVASFEQALATSLLIEVGEGLVVRVASLPGLALLKLTAWGDRGHENNRDAVDLYRLLVTYADAGNTDRLYGPELDLLEAADFDMELAGAELLGRDVIGIASSEAREHVRSLFRSELHRERLLNQMSMSTYAEAAPVVERLLNAFLRGLL